MKDNFNPSQIKLVIGLGNPGKRYENTYHNAGFLFVDYLLKKKPAIYNFQFPISKPLKSGVHMNESGKFVHAALKKHRIKPEELLIVHDDSDIELGKYKLSFGRGAAGHKGIESIISVLKTSAHGESPPKADAPREHASGGKNFWRLRVGIRKANPPSLNLPAGQAGLRRARAGEFVLKKISASDKKILEEVFRGIEADLRR